MCPYSVFCQKPSFFCCLLRHSKKFKFSIAQVQLKSFLTEPKLVQPNQFLNNFSLMIASTFSEITNYDAHVQFYSIQFISCEFSARNFLHQICLQLIHYIKKSFTGKNSDIDRVEASGKYKKNEKRKKSRFTRAGGSAAIAHFVLTAFHS